MLNLAVLLEESARRHPTQIAFVQDDRRLTFRQVNQAANQIAQGLLELGVCAGERVALSCPNLLEFPQVYYGILKTGAVVVPLNIQLKQREIAFHLQDCEASFYICMQDLPGLPMLTEAWPAFQQVSTCRELIVITLEAGSPTPLEGVKTLGQLQAGKAPVFDTVQTRADDSAVILYTSGTTGQPKGAELSHANMLVNAMVCQDLLGSRVGDVQLIVLPLYHSMAQTVIMNSGLYAGASSVLMTRFEPQAVLETLLKEKVTIFGGVPTMYWAILNSLTASGFDPSGIKQTLRVCGSGGASLPEQIKLRFESLFETQILEGYGLSETSPAVCFTHRDQTWKKNSLGTPVWGVEVKIVDDQDRELPCGQAGELVVRGHNVMKGYYGQPQASAEALRHGWFHTGDIGRMDQDGYFYLLDRKKDMILRGGQNIYPREVEEALMAHPAIALAAVIGVPDEEYGEQVKAFVVLKPGALLSVGEIVEWSQANMASYQAPRQVEIRPALPVNATGKVNKKELRG